jgi:hypothetical protein
MIKIISWFTTQTPYEQVIEQCLIPSLKKLQLDYHIYPVSSQGDWIKNTQLKPSVVRQAINDFPNHDLVIVDADCTINEYPQLFKDIPREYDLGVFRLDRNAWYGIQGEGFKEKELCSGTLFFRNRPEVMELIESWNRRCYGTNLPDQLALQEVIEGFYWLKIYPLPLSYCYINSLPDGSKGKIPVEKPVITHHQASRQLRQIVR